MTRLIAGPRPPPAIAATTSGMERCASSPAVIAGRIRRLLAMADKRAEELGIPDTEASLTPDMLAEDA